MLHFVGFKDDRYWNAVRIFGYPDFIHRVWDHRAKAEIVDGDLCVFAKGDPDHPSPYNHDDSNQKDDPAYAERGSSPGLDTVPRVDR